MADRDLTVSATIEGNASGAQSVVDGLNKIKDAAAQSGGDLNNLDSSAKKSGESLTGDLSKGALRAREIVGGLSQTLRGGSEAFFGLGRVVQGVMTAIGGSMAAAAGSIGIIIGVIITVIMKLVEAFRAMSAEAAKNFDILKTNADEIKNTEQVWDGQIDKLNQMESEYRDAAAASDALRSAQEKHLDAKLNMQLKQLDLEEQRALAGAGGDRLKESAIKSEFSQKRFMATTAREDEKNQAKIAAYNDQLERNGEQMIDVNAQLGRHKQVLALINPKFEQLAFALGMSIEESRLLISNSERYRELLKKAVEAEKSGDVGLDPNMLSMLGQYGAQILGAERGIRTAEKQKGKLTTEYEMTTIARNTEQMNIQASQSARQMQAFDQGRTSQLSMDQLASEMRRLTDAIAAYKQAEFDATTSSGTIESLNAARAGRFANEKQLAEVSARYNSLQAVSQQSAGAMGQDYVAGTKSPQVTQAMEAVQQATGEAGQEMATSVRGMGQTVTTSMSQVGQEMMQSLGAIQETISSQNQSIQNLKTAVEKTAAETATVKQQVANGR